MDQEYLGFKPSEEHVNSLTKKAAHFGIKPYVNSKGMEVSGWYLHDKYPNKPIDLRKCPADKSKIVFSSALQVGYGWDFDIISYLESL